MKNQEYISTSLQSSGFLTDFSLLIKFRLTSMVVFTSVAAFLIASSFQVSALSIIVLTLGGYLITGASNALNQVIEKDYDKLMKRTKDRPIAANRMSVSQGLMIAGIMSLLGISLLAFFNPLTAFLGMLSLITYAFVYTPLKRYSSVAVLVGAIPGAMPMLIGSVAFDGNISALAILLFGIQFFWQFTHFWAIAKMGFEEYEKAGFNFVPKTDNNEIDSNIGLQAFLSTILLTGTCLYLGLKFDLNTSLLFVLLALCLFYSVEAFRFWRDMTQKRALRLLFASIAYLPLALFVLLLNQAL